MARRTRSAFLENRTARLKLAARKKPYTALIAPGIFLAYRRNAGLGTWSVKCNGWLKRFALADDHEDANNNSVMSYWDALGKANTLAGADEGSSERPFIVSEAVDAAVDRFPEQLELALRAKGRSVAVVNAGLVTDTAARALRRFDRVITDETDAVILVIGGTTCCGG